MRAARHSSAISIRLPHLRAGPEADDARGALVRVDAVNELVNDRVELDLVGIAPPRLLA
jgi:hypothetical protein